MTKLEVLYILYQPLLPFQHTVKKSELETEGIELKEEGRYLAVTMSEEQINNGGLRLVLSTRKKETNRRITVTYLNDKKNDSK